MKDDVLPMTTMGRRAIAVAALALGILLALHLTVALLSGMLLYTLGIELAGWLEQRVGLRHGARWSVAALAVVLVAGIAGLVRFIPEALATGASYPAIIAEIGTALERLHGSVPAWLAGAVPDSLHGVREQAMQWAREHAAAVQRFGTDVLRGVAHLVVGAIIGTLAVLQTGGRAAPAGDTTPWVAALSRRFALFAKSFESVIYAQIRIAAINTALTALYVLVVLPALGRPLPLAWTVVGVTFALGLVPIVGNLVSNTLIVLLSITHGIGTAALSLGFLVAVHKLEYFLNAHIIGQRTQTRTFEMLACMLVFEAAFGVPGLVAAPVVYAYAKAELREAGWLA
jgi:predicted PurR-regulated permease PerM